MVRRNPQQASNPKKIRGIPQSICPLSFSKHEEKIRHLPLEGDLFPNNLFQTFYSARLATNHHNVHTDLWASQSLSIHIVVNNLHNIIVRPYSRNSGRFNYHTTEIRQRIHVRILSPKYIQMPSAKYQKESKDTLEEEKFIFFYKKAVLFTLNGLNKIRPIGQK